jgi:hypothetical protein
MELTIIAVVGDQRFEFGLDLLIDGLAARLAFRTLAAIAGPERRD